MKEVKTSQEEFWAGKFGGEYTERSKGNPGNRLALFSKIFARTEGVNSVIEYGANRGNNLITIKQLLPHVEVTGVEINPVAYEYLKSNPNITAYNQSIIDFSSPKKWDFVFTRGVLIHIAPEKLSVVYDLLYESSSRYICVGEYYSPKPTAIDYWGHKDKLFKRDFAGEILTRFNSLRLIDYGFVYHKDPNFPQDDITWFLMEKRNYKS